ncbi:FadR/GntR family transcriptional regulator [Streptomyces sp. NPDC056672]|uniref:FadR/GntR family transcriptional regulator n=1 Tax=Streptomyces sp. NPDC056672 TaxID=3345906 RepID=UPI0036C4022F
MRLYMALDHFDIEDVLGTRLVLEREAARAAPLRRTDEQLLGMDGLLDEMVAVVGDPTRYIPLDSKFHVVIALMSGNRLLAHLMGSMRDAIAENLLRSKTDEALWPSLAGRAQENNHALLQAVRDQAPDAAAAAVERQMDFYDQLHP